MREGFARIVKIYREHRWIAFVAGCLLGAISFLLIYGYRLIDVTNIDWLLHSDDLEGSIDLTQHYLGWEFYRNSPWQFPLGLTEGLYAEPVSVVYTDSIPLFAVIFKLLSPMLPARFQYFGLYGLLSYSFMGGFGALITRRESANAVVNLCGSLFFVLSPVMLNRMYLHTALAAHFLIVAGICLWLYRKTFSRYCYLALWCILTTAATLINAYFTPMILGILLCSLLQEWFEGEKFRIIFISAVLPCVFLLAAGYVMGMFYGDVQASGGGLDILSYNLNGLVNPGTFLSHYGKRTFDSSEFVSMNYSGILPAFGLYTEYQNEGFAYLGLGMMFLLVVVSVMGLAVLGKKRPGEELVSERKIISRVAAVMVYLGVFTFLALSPRWTLGGREIFYISYPEVVFRLLSIFRSTGRFIWPVYYLLMALGLIAFLKLNRESGCRAVIFLVAVTVLQIYDLTPGFVEKHEAFTETEEYVSVLKSDAWEYLAKTGNGIIFYPPTLEGLYYDCKTSMEFEIYALAHDMGLNMTYMSRDLTRQADEKAYAHFAERERGLRNTGKIYVFFDCVSEKLPDAEKYGLQYYKIDGYIVGTELNLEGFRDVQKVL